MSESLDLRHAYTVRLNSKGVGSIEYLPAGEWCAECGGHIDLGACVKCGDESE
jgi:hypothetical protein